MKLRMEFDEELSQTIKSITIHRNLAKYGDVLVNAIALYKYLSENDIKQILVEINGKIQTINIENL